MSGLKLLVTVLVTTTVTLPLPQESLAVGLSKVQGVPHATTLLLAQVIVGGVLSTIVTTCVHVVLLPHASVTLHTRVATNVWPQVKLVNVLTMPRFRFGAGVQLSDIIGTVKSQDKPHSRNSFCPQLIVGGVVSA